MLVPHYYAQNYYAGIMWTTLILIWGHLCIILFFLIKLWQSPPPSVVKQCLAKSPTNCCKEIEIDKLYFFYFMNTTASTDFSPIRYAVGFREDQETFFPVNAILFWHLSEILIPWNDVIAWTANPVWDTGEDFLHGTCIDPGRFSCTWHDWLL